MAYNEAEKLCKAHPDIFRGKGIFLSTMPENSNVGLCCIDIDAHRAEDGSENELANEILQMFSGTYAERSPSGKGIHVLFLTDLNQIPKDASNKRLSGQYYTKNSKDELEIYIGGLHNRYLTFTEQRISEHDVITDQTKQVLAFLDHYMKKPNNGIVR